MRTQSVMTTVLNESRHKSESTLLKENPADIDFGILMSRNLNTTKNTDYMDKVSGSDRKKTGSTYKSESEIERMQQNKENVRDRGTKGKESVRSGESRSYEENKTDSAQKTVRSADDSKQVKKDDSEYDIAVMDQAAALQSFKENILNILGMGEQELDQFLLDNGLSLSDLIQPDHLKALVLFANGKEDVTDFLTNDEMISQLDQLTNAAQEIPDDLNGRLSGEVVPTPAGLAADPSEADNGKETLLTENLQVKDKNRSVQEESKNFGTESALSEREQMQENGPVVEVVKLGDAKEQTQNESRASEGKETSSNQLFDNFLANLTEVNQEIITQDPSGTIRTVELREIAGQIIERIRVTIQPDQTSMNLQLNPEHLGRVNLQVQSKDGIMAAHFTVQNELAKEAIEGQLQTLKDTLAQQGLKVEVIEVTVDSYSFGHSDEQNRNQQQSDGKSTRSGRSGRISMEDALNMTEEAEAAGELDDIHGVTGTNINMTV